MICKLILSNNLNDIALISLKSWAHKNQVGARGTTTQNSVHGEEFLLCTHKCDPV